MKKEKCCPSCGYTDDSIVNWIRATVDEPIELMQCMLTNGNSFIRPYKEELQKVIDKMRQKADRARKK